jgi:16S rRNA (adenine1518-N6/adenine1519-N6)-dimethyltransferase
MSKRHRLGQHFLISQSVAKKIVNTAKITKDDIVLEIGTGHGILIPYLCKKAKKVISIESEKKLYLESISKFKNFSNLVLKHENGFKSNEKFSILVSNLPYSQSRLAMEWLIQKKFSRAILMVQTEFAEKILASGKDRKAISILVNHSNDVELEMKVNRSNFSPMPNVNSTVIKLTRKKQISKNLIKTVNQLFSYRRKKIQNISKKLGLKLNSEKRLDELSGDKIIEIAKQIIKK